ncbi:MAG: hypothetical protein REI09_13605 [Candidatus Dactylopiibacterium sp.]|nr:hypothetical protein [Candidatus Dactylopiibacterium sp.]
MTYPRPLQKKGIEMGLLDWFRGATPKIEEGRVSQAAIDDAIDYLVKMTDARLTLVHHYRLRLTGPVTRTLGYIQQLRGQIPPTRDASPLSWSLDPTMRAMFGQSADLLRTFSQSNALRDYATGLGPMDPLFAVMGMDFEEQRRLGTVLHGELVMRDAAQTALSFRNQRLRLFGHSEAELRQAFSRRMLDELAMIALERMQDEHDQRRALEEDRLLLSARLTAFRQRGTGLDSVLGEEGADVSNLQSMALLHELEENETRLAALGCASDGLERQLAYLEEVLAEPMRYIRVEHRSMRVDSMNMLVEAPHGEEITFGVASFDRRQPITRAFLPLRIDRALIGDGRQLRLENAERWL